MGNNDSKIASSSKVADRNAAIKLIFPSHGLPFAIPFSILPDLVSKIDEILKDMEKKTADPRETCKRRLPSGRLLESPSPGDWVLIDVDNSQLIHNSVMAIQVVEGGTYLVLPMRCSDISEDDLKEAIKAVRTTTTTTTRPVDDLLPSYSSG